MPQGMMSVGDAVLTFLGDTTQLDQAFATVATKADASMSRAAASVEQVGDAATGSAVELEAVGESAATAGAEVATGMDAAAVSVRGVGEQARVVEEMIGVRLPRGVNRFLAELPAVQGAMSAAFGAGVVYFLVEALAQGAEKLSKWVADTFIFTQAMKDSDAALLSLNKRFIENAQSIDKAKKALEEYGLSSVQKAIKEHNDALAENNAKIEANKLKIAELIKEQQNSVTVTSTIVHGMVIQTQHYKDNTQAVQDLKNANSLLARSEELVRLELQLLNEEAEKQKTADHLAAAKREIAIDESVGLAKIKSLAAFQKYEASFARDSADAILRIEQEEAEKEYQLKLQTLERERAAEQKAAPEQVRATNAKIEALNAEHDAKVLEMAKETDERILRMHADMAAKAAAATASLFPSLPADTRNLLSMSQAAERLGITLSTDLAKRAKDAQEALALLDKEYKAGIISQRDYQSAVMKALQAQIEYDKELGKSPALVKAEEAELDKLKKKFDGTYGSKGTSELSKFFDLFHRRSRQGQQDAKALEESVRSFMTEVSQAYATAIAGAIQSGESIGAALEKATKAILTQIATQALVQSLYSTALGFLRLAQRDLPGAATAFTAAAEFGAVAAVAGSVGMAIPGGGSGSNSSQQGPSVGQASMSGGGSQQTVGTTHMAAGGVIVAGEAGTEAILPLTDPEAMSRIAGALLSPSTLRRASAGRSSGGASFGGGDGTSGEEFARSGGSSSGYGGSSGPVIHVHVAGLISPDNLKKVIRQQNRMVGNRQATLNASNSLRVTRRSQ